MPPSDDPAVHPHDPHARPLALPHPGWVYKEKIDKEKIDGWRIIVYKDGDRVRLVSRRGRDHTGRFRDMAAAIANLSCPSRQEACGSSGSQSR
jgi:ATP-dependent DNA ligase